MSVSVRTPEIRGVREALGVLSGIDPKLRRASTKTIRRAAFPLQQAARAKVPGSPPLSGWTRGRYAFSGKARTGVRVQVGGRAPRNRSAWPLVTLQQTDAGGAVFDMAGRRSSGKSPQGRAFIRGLNARGGRASRSMWPAAEAQLGNVQSTVADAVREVVAESQRQLDT